MVIFQIRGVKEELREDIESVTLDILKKEVELVLERSEVDIIHLLVGRRIEGKPRAILVKFLSHKSEEKVLKVKKKLDKYKNKRRPGSWNFTYF